MTKFRTLLASIISVALLGSGVIWASDIQHANWSETAASNNAATPNGAPEGMAPSTVNDTMREMMAAIKREWNRSHVTISSTGSANAYVLTYTTAPTLTNGMRLSFKASFANTGAATVNPNSLGVTDIVKQTTAGQVALVADDIVSTQHVDLEYDSATGDFVLLNAQAPDVTDDIGGAVRAVTGTTDTILSTDAGKLVTFSNAAAIAVTLPQATSSFASPFYVDIENIGAGVVTITPTTSTINGAATYILGKNQGVRIFSDSTNYQIQNGSTPETAVVGESRGLIITNNAGTPNSQVDIDADEIVLKTTAGLTYLASSVNLTINIAAAGANGLDTGSEGSSRWYFLYVIYNGTTVAGLMSESATAPTMPAGYTYKALMGAIYNDGSSNFYTSWQYGREAFIEPVSALSAGNPGAADTYESLSIATSVPSIAKIVTGTAGSADAAADTSMWVAGDANGVGQCVHQSDGASPTTGGWAGASSFRVPLITAATIYWKMQVDAADGVIEVSGYVI